MTYKFSVALSRNWRWAGKASESVAVDAIEAITLHTLCCAGEIPMAAAFGTERTIAGAEKRALGGRTGEPAGTECPPEQARRQITSSAKWGRTPEAIDQPSPDAGGSL
jgi:hypothetical protein